MPSLSRRATALLAALVLLCALGGAAAWHWWPRQVAPALTSGRVTQLHHLVHGHVVVVEGGSRRDAHTLWSRYHDRPAAGTPATKPRLVGISLVHVSGSPVSEISGRTWWVIYTDRVWGMPAGPGSPGFGSTVVLVDPSTLEEAHTSWEF